MIAPLPALRIGTRPSLLARAQAGLVADALRARGIPAELTLISTAGDRSSAPLTAIGGTGVFVTAVRAALLDGRIDLAVHSLKDLPVSQPCDLTIAAIPERADPRDVLIAAGSTLATLPAGARIGTGSPRRALHLRRRRPDLAVTGLRGNVDSRINRVATGELDGVVLAAAGLARLSRSAEADEFFSVTDSPPAPGQGALAIECRAGDASLIALLSTLDHLPTRLAAIAERSILAGLDAGCTAPVGAYAQVSDGLLSLQAVIWRADGGPPLTAAGTLALPGSSAQSPAAEIDITGEAPLCSLATHLGLRLARNLLAAGASEFPGIGDEARPAHPDDVPGPAGSCGTDASGGAAESSGADASCGD